MRIEEVGDPYEDAKRSNMDGLREIVDRVDFAVLNSTPLDTGELLQSYYSGIDGDGNAIIGFDADYALPVEVGHEAEDGSFVSGQRFLWEALREAEDND